MRRADDVMTKPPRVVAPLSALAFVLAACGGAVERPTPGGTSSTPPAPTSSPPPAPPSVGPAPSLTCCPIDDQPGCCMHYGGTSLSNGGDCAALCDGMALPGDPAWAKGVDRNGCPIWVEPPHPAHVCGEPVIPDAGPDTNPSCCPIEPAPACCMLFGGAEVPGNSCGASCDGMASPTDPGWKLST